jgi:hypothetical protein
MRLNQHFLAVAILAVTAGLGASCRSHNNSATTNPEIASNAATTPGGGSASATATPLAVTRTLPAEGSTNIEFSAVTVEIDFNKDLQL